MGTCRFKIETTFDFESQPGAIISPDSEELLDLILKNDINDSISIKKLNTNAAKYIKQAVQEKR